MKYCTKNIEKHELEAIHVKKMRQENDCFATRYYRRIDSEQSSQSNYSICNSILVYDSTKY